MYNRGRKRKLTSIETDHIEHVENLSFLNGIQFHYAVIVAEGVDNGASERTVQRAMAESGVGTFMAMQKKALSKKNLGEHIQ